MILITSLHVLGKILIVMMLIGKYYMVLHQLVELDHQEDTHQVSSICFSGQFGETLTTLNSLITQSRPQF